MTIEIPYTEDELLADFNPYAAHADELCPPTLKGCGFSPKQPDFSLKSY